MICLECQPLEDRVSMHGLENNNINNVTPALSLLEKRLIFRTFKKKTLTYKIFFLCFKVKSKLIASKLSEAMWSVQTLKSKIYKNANINLFQPSILSSSQMGIKPEVAT